MKGCVFFEFWGVEFRFLIIFTEEFAKLSLITARDNRIRGCERASEVSTSSFLQEAVFLLSSEIINDSVPFRAPYCELFYIFL